MINCSKSMMWFCALLETKEKKLTHNYDVLSWTDAIKSKKKNRFLLQQQKDDMGEKSPYTQVQ